MQYKNLGKQRLARIKRTPLQGKFLVSDKVPTPYRLVSSKSRQESVFWKSIYSLFF